MSKTVIEIDNLAKKYHIGAKAAQADGLRHAIESAIRAPLAWMRNGQKSRASREEFWALRNINLDVKEGEVVGIVGRNGAGKSTLLKILSRISEPTQGRIRLRGRVASLLEVGTGFHPELTGRENIFLNGAILGMSRGEINRKFDEIVAFAEIDRFIDTPVKRYSSGMYVRLAFAVAAHLEPEILIVDEVLAVGDAPFQKKCLGKMKNVASGGRTILFVSHNLGAVSNLCDRGIYLKRGELIEDAPIQDALATYVKESRTHRLELPVGSNQPRIVDVRVDQEKLVQGILMVMIDFDSPFPLEPPIGGVTVSDIREVPIFGTNARMHSDGFAPQSASRGTIYLETPPLPLHTGEYLISVWLGDARGDFDAWIPALSFEFVSPFYSPHAPSVAQMGPLNITGRWSLDPIETEANTAGGADRPAIQPKYICGRV